VGMGEALPTRSRRPRLRTFESRFGTSGYTGLPLGVGDANEGRPDGDVDVLVESWLSEQGFGSQGARSLLAVALDRHVELVDHRGCQSVYFALRPLGSSLGRPHRTGVEATCKERGV